MHVNSIALRIIETNTHMHTHLMALRLGLPDEPVPER